MLCLDPLGFVLGYLRVHDVVPPQVATVGPRGVLAGALDRQHVLDRLARPGGGGLAVAAERLVHEGLQGEVGAAPVAAVGRDDELGLGVVDALAQALRAEAAEDDRVNRADARAGEHRDDGLGDLRQVDRDAVALADAEALQPVGGLLDALEHVGVGEGLGVAGLALEMEGDAVAAALATWRSTALSQALSVPSGNHRATGASDQSRISVKGAFHERLSAASRQYSRRSTSAFLYSYPVALACAANVTRGGNVRVSVCKFSSVWRLGTWPPGTWASLTMEPA